MGPQGREAGADPRELFEVRFGERLQPPLALLGSRDVVTVGPRDTALDALHVMIDEEVEHVPVVEGGRLVGICTRTDLLKVRRSERETERHSSRRPGLVRRAPDGDGRPDALADPAGSL
ncbi:MAG TPA: CBS domain-containing protein [Acidimicrobiales bacterium]|nr:CBS domain-containing protein [Acidimicrobiales bacterium]